MLASLFALALATTTTAVETHEIASNCIVTFSVKDATIVYHSYEWRTLRRGERGLTEAKCDAQAEAYITSNRAVPLKK